MTVGDWVVPFCRDLASELADECSFQLKYNWERDTSILNKLTADEMVDAGAAANL